jgi:hypothetical protein
VTIIDHRQKGGRRIRGDCVLNPNTTWALASIIEFASVKITIRLQYTRRNSISDCGVLAPPTNIHIRCNNSIMGCVKNVLFRRKNPVFAYATWTWVQRSTSRNSSQHRWNLKVHGDTRPMHDSSFIRQLSSTPSGTRISLNFVHVTGN